MCIDVRQRFVYPNFLCSNFIDDSHHLNYRDSGLAPHRDALRPELKLPTRYGSGQHAGTLRE
jgi:hypothetical protein